MVDETADTPAGRAVASTSSEPSAWNLPNAITISRFVLALVLFGMIDAEGLWVASAAIFIVAASTDFLDGYLARKYGQVTVLGRILDPFVDKIIICGSFVFLAAIPDSGICAWTAFIVLGREMLITSLRSVLEARGVDFSAQWLGKLKMAVQCVAVPVSLLSLSTPFLETLPVSSDIYMSFRAVVIWGTVGITLLSGFEYVRRAITLVSSK